MFVLQLAYQRAHRFSDVLLAVLFFFMQDEQVQVADMRAEWASELIPLRYAFHV